MTSQQNYPTPRYHDHASDLCLLNTNEGPCICDVLQIQESRGYSHGRISSAADILSRIPEYGEENDTRKAENLEDLEDRPEDILTRLVWMEAMAISADIALGDSKVELDGMLAETELLCEHHDVYFDRNICPPPCGAMHTYCADCGANLDECALDRGPENGIPL